MTGNNLVPLGQWIALTTGALAILLVISQTVRACILQLQRRSRRSSQVEPDEERGADGHRKSFSPSARSLQSLEKKDHVFDQPPIDGPLSSLEGPELKALKKGQDLEESFSNLNLASGPKCDLEWEAADAAAGPAAAPTAAPAAPVSLQEAVPAMDLPTSACVGVEVSTTPIADNPMPTSKAEISIANEVQSSLVEETDNFVSIASDNRSHFSQMIPKPPTLEPRDVKTPQNLTSPSAARSLLGTTASPQKAEEQTLPHLDSITFNATFTLEDPALGFELRFVGGCPVVTKVVDRSPACVKGVSVQNRALAVNGVPLRGTWPLRKMSKQQWLASVFSSRPLTITFEQIPSKALLNFSEEILH